MIFVLSLITPLAIAFCCAQASALRNAIRGEWFVHDVQCAEGIGGVVFRGMDGAPR